MANNGKSARRRTKKDGFVKCFTLFAKDLALMKNCSPPIGREITPYF